ncbi:MAG: DUF2126 domain-containing protein [Candidatus Competibacterales bacterium]
MAIRVAVDHYTRYHYDRLVTLSPQVVRLRPAPHCRTPILAYSLHVEPKTHFVNWQQDPFGNYLARLVFPEKTQTFAVRVDLVADMTVVNPFDFFLEEHAVDYPFRYEATLAEELTPYLKVREAGPRLMAWLAGVDRRKRPTNDFLVELNQKLQAHIGYLIRLEPGIQSCEATLKLGTGSCRDTAWLLVQALRHLGLAARFVSGYFHQLTGDIKALDGPSGPEADFTDLHAWAEVYLPGAGWVGLDPTSGLFAGEGHIPLACSPDPGSASPITGKVSESKTDFYFHNRVSRIHETPRVTKPYTEVQWQAIDALGRKVDTDLKASDVRLTMGGEPTFVSVDDMESPQWNTDALGEHKRTLAYALIQGLRRRFAPFGMLHHSQGKWYPGEPVPRWALSLHWRRDGQPLWRHPAALADERQTYGFTRHHAQRFIEALCTRLGIDTQRVMPAFEDPFYYLQQEQNLPVNLDPLAADLKDPEERQRLARVLSQGLDEPVGFVLPLRQDPMGSGTWQSSPWPLRRQRLFLIPGDSPLGLRLPLDSLPWITEAEAQQEQLHDRDPLADRPPLGNVQFRHHPALDNGNGASVKAPSRPSVHPGAPRWADVIKTALAVEVREGALHVFLPPLNTLEAFVDLVSQVEATAMALELPVFPEGYPPPRDHRLVHLSVTPDPGVIEVNVHPAASWEELVDNTTALYDEAHRVRLGTEKFMLDGKHTGTGGGNHVTIGGPTPVDSPLLRRPDLLASLVSYWQHHPALSYLFSGLFIGPTSQAPRVDEARQEALYELEIALQQSPTGEVPQPWLVDRLFRNLLVDLTGNTHRAEFCIDKLFSPDSANGRLGLLELRGFEMPPHARMSLVQMLLIRALVALFWRQPYRPRRLVRWGTALHDRFMLPHFVERDIKDVLRDLDEGGYPFPSEWLAPFVEFRFPHYGQVQVDDITLELRAAMEPWPVLGEESTSLGTARYVDSSVERLQVKATGLSDGRHTVTCNGRPLPLHATGTHGEYVAGVRYRAWQPPSALHPTIPVDVPLVFDIVDTWSGRAIAGCTYHVAHPGGRAHEAFPVNANAAETRRGERFATLGHTPGTIPPPPQYLKLVSFYPQGSPEGPFAPAAEAPNPEYPHTLDMRRRPRP